MYYPMSEYIHTGFEKSEMKGKMYNAILKRKSDGKFIKVPFGHNTMENFRDKTGLNAYPHLIHGDEERRKKYHARHKGYIREGFYSPGYFSLNFLW